MLNKVEQPKSVRNRGALDPVWLNHPITRRFINDLRGCGFLADIDAHDKGQIARALMRAAGVGIKVSSSREG